MDRVRLGRVLGRGARMAARTVYEAMDAATANDPRSNPSASGSRPVSRPVMRQSQAPEIQRSERQSSKIRPAVPAASSPGRPKGQRSQRQKSERDGSGIFTPVKRASRAVTLEVTGSFFALFAFSFAVGVWHGRAAITQGGSALYRFALYCAVTLVFGYFAISNFVRARRLS